MKSRKTKALLIIAGICLVLLIGYFILNAVVNTKIANALKELPRSIQLKYSSLHASIINSSLVIDDLVVKYIPEENSKHQHDLSSSRISFNGIHFLKLLSSKKLSIQSINLDSGKIRLD